MDIAVIIWITTAIYCSSKICKNFCSAYIKLITCIQSILNLKNVEFASEVTDEKNRWDRAHGWSYQGNRHRCHDQGGAVESLTSCGCHSRSYAKNVKWDVHNLCWKVLCNWVLNITLYVFISIIVLHYLQGFDYLQLKEIFIKHLSNLIPDSIIFLK